MRDLWWYLWNAGLGIALGVCFTAGYLLLFFIGIKIISWFKIKLK